MEVHSPVETLHGAKSISQIHHSSIKSQHLSNLECAVNLYNKSSRIQGSCVYKENLVSKRNDLLVRIGQVVIVHIHLSSKDMSHLKSHSPNTHGGATLSQPENV